MKTHSHHRRSAVALVIVLGFLVIITVVIVAFFSSATTELGSSHAQADAMSARQLADSTTQYVIGQIRQATSGGTDHTWASQPGMIRTYDADGKAEKGYKLYSAATMVDTLGGGGATYDPGADMPTSEDWAADKAIWSDLNTPVINRDGETIFPIIDPRAAAKVEQTAGSGTSSSLVEGFSYDAAALTGAVLPADKDDKNARAPMPVRWLYMLRDGRFTTPSSGSGTLADFTASNPKPTEDNPIVGRVAFWTDDETCKLNLNTAADSNPWDIPTYTAGIDLYFSRYKPVKYEYARYPGHPATTSLRPVLWYYGGLESPDYSLYPTLNPPLVSGSEYRFIGSAAAADVAPALSTLASDYFQKVLSLNPRNMWGGTEMGSIASVVGMNDTVNPQPIDSDRLYASTAEMLFGMSDASATERPANAFNLTDSDVKRLDFFLTTQSRSPDTNPFNQPKVGIWPIPKPGVANPANPDSTTDSQTPTDKLLAFCSTLNGNAYYFTRNNPDSPRADFVPGSRNDQVFDYLDRSLQNNIPGFGGSLGTRYGQGTVRQILTQIYDYIRGSVNITDTFGVTGFGTGQSNFPYAFVPSRNATHQQGRGQVIPIVITKDGKDYKGHGRFIAIKEVGLHFIAAAANQPPVKVVTSGIYKGRPQLFKADGTTRLDDNGVLTEEGIVAVLRGEACAVPNPMHPWVGGDLPMPLIHQYVEGDPVLAVNQDKLSTNPDDASAIYPVFNPDYEYPTIGNTNKTPPLDDNNSKTIKMVGTGGQKKLVHNGVTYHYVAAARNVAPSALQVPAQTHAGLPYLTIPRASGSSSVGAMEGAYDVPNPRYQGLNGGTATTLADALQTSSESTATVLSPGKTQIKAAFLFAPVVLNPGEPPYSGLYKLVIKGLGGFKASNRTLGFASTVEALSTESSSIYGTTSLQWIAAPETSSTTAVDPVIVNLDVNDGAAFNFQGGTITIEIRSCPTGDVSDAGELIQTVEVNFPSSVFPTPLLPPMPNQDVSLEKTVKETGNESQGFSSHYDKGIPQAVEDLTSSTALTFLYTSPLGVNPNFGVGATLYIGGKSRLSLSSDFINRILPERIGNPGAKYQAKLTADTIRTVELLYGDARVESIKASISAADQFFKPHVYYDDLHFRAAHTFRAVLRGDMLPGGTDHALATSASGTGGLVYTTANFRGQPSSIPGVSPDIEKKIQALAGHITSQNTSTYARIASVFPNVTSSVDFSDSTFATTWNNGGDYDTGQGFEVDGPYINKPNEGGGMRSTSAFDAYSANPDFSDLFAFSFENLNNSPNRQVPSPVIFGSLLVGNTPQTSWRTLLFSPNPGSTGHLSLSEVPDAGAVPTAGKAPDYLLLDFFNMPVVEPYAISDSFSTAGRVNMNFQIAPFTYIRRDTALRGVLRSTLVTAAQDERVQDRKRSDAYNQTYNDGVNGPYTQYLQQTGHWAFRYPVHVGETLKQFEARFSHGDLFRSPAEICSLWLYPAKQPTASAPENPGIPLVNWNASSSNIKGWWYNDPEGERKSVTGDNVRERPYSTLYPRLTTKSNTYTTYFRVQLLQKSRGTEVTQWVEGRDQVRSEYRGSAMIERYVDVADPDLPDFTASDSKDISLDDYYRYRVLDVKRFAP